MNNAFEYLLKQLGWKRTIMVENVSQKTWFDPNTPNTWIDGDAPTYDFISSIGIEDVEKYMRELYFIVTESKPSICGGMWLNPTNKDVFRLHIATLDQRILAHARTRGFEG